MSDCRNNPFEWMRMAEASLSPRLLDRQMQAIIDAKCFPQATDPVLRKVHNDAQKEALLRNYTHNARGLVWC